MTAESMAGIKAGSVNWNKRINDATMNTSVLICCGIKNL